MKSTNLLTWALFLKWKLRPSLTSVIFRHLSAALCFNINYSRNKNVLLWSTLCLTWSWATQVWGVYVFLQSSHCKLVTTNSTTKLYCKRVLFMTSFWTVSLTLILLEWGSVHTNPASMSFTLLSPFINLRQMERSSGDSSSTCLQGGA